jgi:hypothetical protein
VGRDLQVLGVRRWRELVIDREKWRGIYCSTGQSPQQAIAPTEKEEEGNVIYKLGLMLYA